MKRYVLGLLLTSSMLMQAPLPDLRAQATRKELQEKLKDRAKASGNKGTLKRIAQNQQESVDASQEFVARMIAANKAKNDKNQRNLSHELKGLAQNPAKAAALSEVLEKSRRQIVKPWWH